MRRAACTHSGNAPITPIPVGIDPTALNVTKASSFRHNREICAAEAACGLSRGMTMTTTCRSVFLSDVHLGTADCQAELLADFLAQLRCRQIYLVGDIIDVEALEAGSRWTAAHSGIVLRLFELAANGVEVIYLPGNHDAALRRFAGQTVGGIEVALEAVHLGVDGRRYRVSHGDEFDPGQVGKRWLIWLGEHVHRALCWAHRHVNGLRARARLPYWPMAVLAKTRISAAMAYIDGFERRVALHAKDHGFDGHICGHIHFGHLRDIGGVRYMNDGDWVEHCTVLLEHHDGRFELRPWRPVRRSRSPRVEPPGAPVGEFG